MVTEIDLNSNFHRLEEPLIRGEAAESTADEEAAASTAVATSTLGSAHYNPAALSAEALMFYLSSRMGSLDNQMSEIFDRQQTTEKIRSEIGEIEKLLTNLKTDPNKAQGLDMENHEEFYAQLDMHLNTLAKDAPDLAASMREKLYGPEQIGASNGSTPDQHYSTAEIENTKQYLGLITKDLENSSQMDMIALQSMMGTRQTAIQLSSNLISALHESAKSVVGNIR